MAKKVWILVISDAADNADDINHRITAHPNHRAACNALAKKLQNIMDDDEFVEWAGESGFQEFKTESGGNVDWEGNYEKYGVASKSSIVCREY